MSELKSNDLVTRLRNSAGVCTRAAPEYKGGVRKLFETTAEGFTEAADEIERLTAREKMLLERHTGCGCDTTCPVCDELGFT
jgi:hypothetical protein